MRITIDTDRKSLTLEKEGTMTDFALFSPDAFRVLSREWMRLGWNLGHWSSFSWMGRQFLQFPDDVLRLAEAIWLLKPDVILETGVYDAGGTLFFSSLCRLASRGRVIGIESEIRPDVRSAASRFATLIEGDSASKETACRVRDLIHPGESVFAFLDSDHSARHVAAELENYAGLVTPGSYIVIADSNLPELAGTPEGDPLWVSDHPLAAIEAFLERHPEFECGGPPALFRGAFDFTELSYFARSWLKRR